MEHETTNGDPDPNQMTAAERLKYHAAMQSGYPITNPRFEIHALAAEAAKAELAAGQSKNRHPATTMQT